jgi:hypothetical protein
MFGNHTRWGTHFILAVTIFSIAVIVLTIWFGAAYNGN